MGEEIFAGNDLVPGRCGDLVELVGMLGDETLAASVEFHGERVSAVRTLLANASLANGQHGRSQQRRSKLRLYD
jgi:hypothetical protein